MEPLKKGLFNNNLAKVILLNVSSSKFLVKVILVLAKINQPVLLHSSSSGLDSRV